MESNDYVIALLKCIWAFQLLSYKYLIYLICISLCLSGIGPANLADVTEVMHWRAGRVLCFFLWGPGSDLCIHPAEDQAQEDKHTALE